MITILVRLQNVIAEMRTEMNAALADNPFRGLAEIGIQSVQLQWGWAIIVAEAMSLVASAAVAAGRATEYSKSAVVTGVMVPGLTAAVLYLMDWIEAAFYLLRR